MTGEITNVYDPNSGQLTAVYYGFSIAATATYWNSSESVPLGALGQLDTVTYGNGIEAEYSYNYFGTEDGVSYVNSSGTSVASESVSYSAAGRELTDGFDGKTASNPNGSGPDFTYDGAGRLTQAFVPGEEISYSYGTSAAGS